MQASQGRKGKRTASIESNPCSGDQHNPPGSPFCTASVHSDNMQSRPLCWPHVDLIHPPSPEAPLRSSKGKERERKAKTGKGEERQRENKLSKKEKGTREKKEEKKKKKKKREKREKRSHSTAPTNAAPNRDDDPMCRFAGCGPAVQSVYVVLCRGKLSRLILETCFCNLHHV